MNAINLQLVSEQDQKSVVAVMAADGVVDFVKTMKQELKDSFGILKNWTINEEGTTATSKIDSSILTLMEIAATGSTMARTLANHAKGYEDSISYSGNKSKICGDAISVDLQGLTPDQVITVAEKILGLANGELAAKYDHLNPGQRRMNSGNRIRGAVKKGTVTEEKVLELIAGFNVIPVVIDAEIEEEIDADAGIEEKVLELIAGFDVDAEIEEIEDSSATE